MACKSKNKTVVSKRKPENRQQVFHDLRFCRHRTKMEYQKLTQILGV